MTLLRFSSRQPEVCFRISSENGCGLTAFEGKIGSLRNRISEAYAISILFMSAKNRPHRFCGRIATLVVCLLSCVSFIRSQNHEAKWQRVTTGQDFTIDIDASGLVFEPNRIVRATFRTVSSDTQTLPGDPPIKFKTSLDTIQFNLNGGYRFVENKYVDSKGKVVHTSSRELKEWKPVRGSAGTLRAAVNRWLPFGGSWTVIAYTMIDEGSTGKSDAVDLKNLIGSAVLLELDQARAATKHCSSPAYVSRKLTDQDLEQLLRVSLKRLGVESSHVDVFVMKCETQGWQPGQSILVRISPDRMLMLWEGVFLELRDRSPKSFSVPLVIR